MPICDSGSHAKSIRSESGPIPLFHFNCFRCRLLGVRNWVEEDDDVEGRASVCWRSPKGFLDAMQAGTKGLGLPKRGSLLPIHSSSWRLKVVAFWDVSSTTDAGTSGATSARSRSCRSFWFLPPIPGRRLLSFYKGFADALADASNSSTVEVLATGSSVRTSSATSPAGSCCCTRCGTSPAWSFRWKRAPAPWKSARKTKPLTLSGLSKKSNGYGRSLRSFLSSLPNRAISRNNLRQRLDEKVFSTSRIGQR